MYPPAPGVDTHAAVGKVADVVVARAGRVNHEARAGARAVDFPFVFYGCAAAFVFLNYGTHHPFGRRGAAYIAQTHEKYAPESVGTPFHGFDGVDCR